MIQPATRSGREALAGIFSGDDRVEVRYRLRIGDREFRATELQDLSESDAPGTVLSGAVPGGVPAASQGKRVTLDYLYGPDAIVVRGFTGKLLRSEGKGELAAASTGGRAEDTPLMQKLSYPQSKPSDVLYDAARRLPYERVDIAPAAEPLFDRVDAFTETETVKDVYDAVEEAAGIRVVTDPRNWAVSLPTKPLDAPGHEIEWEVGEDIRDDRDEPFEATLRGEAAYAAVRIYRETDTGVEWLTDSVPVANRHGEPLDAGLVYLEALEDDTPEAYGRALSRALTLARLFAYGDWELSFTTTRLDARVIRGDRALITHRTKEDGARVLRRYRMAVETYERDPVAGGKARYTGEAVLLSERVAPVAAAGPKAGGLSAGMVSVPLGLDYLSRPRLDTSLTWLTYDEGTGILKVNSDLAAAQGVSVTQNTTSDLVVTY